MKNTLNNNFRNIILGFIFTIICGYSTIYGQSYYISGTTIVNQGQSYSYQVYPNYNISFIYWMVPYGGNLTSQNGAYATIEWTGSGSGLVTAGGQDYYSNDIDVSLHVDIVAASPPTPASPTVQSSSCGTVTLQRTGTPPVGTTWYWQSSSSGTSTSDAASTITLTSGSIYYLRAKYNGGLWSTSSSSVSYTIPAAPTWYADVDGDGFGDPNSAVTQCNQPTNYVSNSDDCDDTNVSINPLMKWYADVDGDGFGDPESYITQCTQPTNYVSNNTDGCPNEYDTADGCPSFSDKNYMHITTYLDPFYHSQLDNVTENERIETITYYDGFKKPIQQIGIRQSQNSNDIIQHIYYDEFGRKSKQYLPFKYQQNSGELVENAEQQTLNYYNSIYTDSRPFSETVFDDSPLNQIEENIQIGDDFVSHSSKIDYNTNNQADRKVLNFEVTLTNGIPSLNADPQPFADNQIAITIYKNENWIATDDKKGTIESYKNKSGNIILSREYDDTETALDTYYVYDDFGNLAYILTPKSDATNTVPDTNALNNLCYQYRYDERNRLIEKKIPGKEKEYFVYDNYDRPVLTQDPNLRSLNLWMFSKFDNFGRVIYTGTYSSSSNQSTLQTQIDIFSAANNKSNSENRISTTNTIDGIALNYDNSAFPNTGINQILTVNYYDDYNFTDTDKPTTPTNILNQQVTTRTKGLLTSSWVKTLDENTWTKSYTYYDEKASPIKIYTKNYLGGYTSIESLLDFRGNVDKTVTTHKRLSTDTSVIITDNYSYDNTERLIKQTQKINNQDTETIVENTYDDLGQLIIKKVGGKTNALQIVNYDYNIQGSLTQINDINTSLNGTGENDLFAFKMNFLTNEGTASSTPNYNGNISQTIWKNRHTNEKEAYTYSYDKLNRLNDADYRKGSSLNTGSGNFELHNITFDKNGNIKTLQRKSETSATIDDLSYDYTYNAIDKGNQLQLIVDTSSNTIGFTDGNTSGLDYEYDDNGNLIKDNNKNITNIEYNIIDLPKKVTFSNGTSLEMVYNAAGQKLKKIYNVSGNTTNTYYIGGFQYQESQLQFFAQSEGYVYKDGANYKYTYLFSDHLGNNRLSYTDTSGDDYISSVEILTATNHYPMGMIQSGEFISGIGSNYNYKFQSKELQQESGLQMYDFGSRMYDATTGRWFAIDPQSQFGSPYLAMGNNYISFVDPDGESVIAAVLIGAAVGGIINTYMHKDQIDNFGDGLAAFGIGAAAGAVGGAFGASAAIAAGGVGAIAAAAGGAAGSAVAMPVQSVGNTLYFDDPIMTMEQYGKGVLIGGVLGGVTGGISAQLQGFDFWQGDIVKNASIVNSMFDDVACNGCNFIEGEKLSEFRANLSIDDDFTQLIKAFRKAKIYLDRGLDVRFSDIIDYDISFNAMKTNGWGKDFSFYKKLFTNPTLREYTRVFVPKHAQKNFLIRDVYFEKSSSIGKQIQILGKNHNAPMMKFRFFRNNQSIYADQIWKNINNYKLNYVPFKN